MDAEFYGPRSKSTRPTNSKPSSAAARSTHAFASTASCKSFDLSLAFTYGAPNHTNTRLCNILAALTLLLFTFVCAALYQGFARSGDYCEPLVDTFFFNAMTPMPHSFGAAQAA